MKKFHRLIILSSLILIISANAFAGDSAPSWLRQVASADVPGYAKDVPAVVLHDEQTVTLNSAVKLVTVTN